MMHLDNNNKLINYNQEDIKYLQIIMLKMKEFYLQQIKMNFGLETIGYD